MRNKFLYILTIATLLLSTSCEGFLDKEPEGSIPESEAMTNLDEAQQVNTGIYSQLLVANLWSQELTILPDLQADFVFPVMGYSNHWGDIYRWDILPSSSNVSGIYGALYKLIARCNFFLDNEEAVRETLRDKDEVREMDILTADAYFIRALAYSELIRLWCEDYDPDEARDQLGVSIVKTYTKGPNPIRSSLYDSYEFLFDDIRKADTLFTKNDVESRPNSYYGTPAAVCALGARMALYRKDYQLAVDYSTRVIKEDNLELATPSEYGIMWNYDRSPEVIFRIAMTVNDLGGSLSEYFLGFNYVDYTPDYIPAQWVLNLYATNDYRFNNFFGTVTTGYPHQLRATLLIKYLSNPELDGNTGRYSFRNMPKVFRLSEQYLIRAEAYYNLNDNVRGSDDLNTLRAQRINNYTNQNLSGDNLFDAIKQERIKELYMEGFRLMDLKRWHEGFSRVPMDLTVGPGNSLTVESDDPLFTWPIPQHEINANPGIQKNKSN